METKTSGFVFDEKRHLYYLDGKKMTGCTTILGVLAKPALIQWAANMAVDYIEANWDNYFDQENNRPLPSLLKEARTAHARKRDEAADKGTDTHALVEEYVKLMIADQDGRPLEMNDDETHYWKPLELFIGWARRNNIRFIASEQKVYSKKLFVAGTFDLLFEKDGKRYIGDIKTYKKIWDVVPLIQCAGYALMWEEMQRENSLHYVGKDGAMDEDIDGYCIINLPKEREFDESADVMWSHDPVEYREAFEACVRLYRVLNNN